MLPFRGFYFSMDDLPFFRLFFLRMRLPPIFTLFPYTTLFRSLGQVDLAVALAEGVEERYLQRFGLLRFRYRSSTRSEEHTSELQSHVNLVCRLLLEKKNKISLYNLALNSAFTFGVFVRILTFT